LVRREKRSCQLRGENGERRISSKVYCAKGEKNKAEIGENLEEKGIEGAKLSRDQGRREKKDYALPVRGEREVAQQDEREF